MLAFLKGDACRLHPEGIAEQGIDANRIEVQTSLFAWVLFLRNPLTV